MKTNLTRLLLLPSALLIAATGIANAQATRTWVSGVGDDVNPCSRTAPCKTYAGAISKTASGGEITVLDPGGFGTLTITKPITVNGFGNRGHSLSSGVNCFVINITVAPAAPIQNVVILRNLDISGASATLLGLDAIRFIAGGTLQVENCNIEKFSGQGIDYANAAASNLIVENTTISNCNGGAILVTPGGGQLGFVSLNNVRLERSLFGLQANDGSRVTAKDCVATGNTQNGFLALDAAGANFSLVTLESCVASNNGTNGVHADGAKTIVAISNVTASGNTTGFRMSNSGVMKTFLNNRPISNATEIVGTLTDAGGQK
jgi:hypothetical protein